MTVRWLLSSADHDDLDDDLAVPAESAVWRGEAEPDGADDEPEDEFRAGVREEARMDEWLALHWSREGGSA